MATPEPTATPSLKMMTVAPSAAVPVNSGMVALVRLSVLEAPVSDAGARSGVEGAAGGVVSIVTVSAADAALTLQLCRSRSR